MPRVHAKSYRVGRHTRHSGVVVAVRVELRPLRYQSSVPKLHQVESGASRQDPGFRQLRPGYPGVAVAPKQFGHKGRDDALQVPRILAGSSGESIESAAAVRRTGGHAAPAGDCCNVTRQIPDDVTATIGGSAAVPADEKVQRVFRGAHVDRYVLSLGSTRQSQGGQRERGGRRVAVRAETLHRRHVQLVTDHRELSRSAVVPHAYARILVPFQFGRVRGRQGVRVGSGYLSEGRVVQKVFPHSVAGHGRDAGARQAIGEIVVDVQRATAQQ